jgi:hypothetical protein
MKTFKVIALSVGADSNKIFRAGEIVSADAWQPGRAEELVKQGFLEPCDEVEDPAPVIIEEEVKAEVPEPVLSDPLSDIKSLDTKVPKSKAVKK